MSTDKETGKKIQNQLFFRVSFRLREDWIFCISPPLRPGKFLFLLDFRTLRYHGKRTSKFWEIKLENSSVRKGNYTVQWND